MTRDTEKLPPGVTQAEFEVALDRALAAQHFDTNLKGMLRKLVLDPDDRWRVCCGNDCYICMLPLGHAVDEVREAIGWTRPGAEN